MIKMFYCCFFYLATMAKALSDFTRGRIIGLWEAGTNAVDIASRIKCNERTVRNLINRWQEEGKDLTDRRKNNRSQRSTTAEQDASLVRQVKKNPFLPISHSVNQLDLQISKSTARRRLHEANVHWYRSASSFDSISLEDWDRTIWIDEIVFCLTTNQRLHIWKPEHPLNKKSMSSCGQSDLIICGMLGWISAHCSGELIEVSPCMNAFEYRDIVENILLPSVRKIYSKDDVPIFRLIQKDSAIHTANVIQKWFAQHPEIEVLNWPAKFSNLNLIENIWTTIVNLWDPGYERTRIQLVTHAKDVWDSFRQKPEFFANARESFVKSERKRLSRMERKAKKRKISNSCTDIGLNIKQNTDCINLD